METTLHRQLKEHYADDADGVEVRVGKYRIDALRGEELIEIQHGSLAAIRDKIRALLREHRVRVVKPVIASKLLVKRRRKNGRVVDRRQSPLRGNVLNLFDELVYFTRVFPHPRLTLEVALVDVQEWRYPGHGRRRRRRQRDHVVEDQQLLGIRETLSFRRAGDLLKVLPDPMPQPFDTSTLATLLGVERWIAQRVAYCLRETGAIENVAKRGNALLYKIAESTSKKSNAA